MKLCWTIILGTALAGFAAPGLIHATNPALQQYQNDQDSDRERSTQAYNDGYTQGQADARAHSVRNDRATAQWTKDDDQRAYQQGYDAGFDNVAKTDQMAAPAERLGHGEQQAEQFGYQDGLAAGRQDQMKGNKFRPTDHDLYKSGTHGWTAELGTKDEFKQLYRQSFVKGYEEGYKGTGPR